MNQIISFVLPFAICLLIFYFMLLLPEKKRKKRYSEMLSALQTNDEVLTTGGIIGKIINIDEENVVIESGADRTKIKFSKRAIASKIYKEKK